jgi:fibronectin-binding autotransporter adhesin
MKKLVSQKLRPSIPATVRARVGRSNKAMDPAVRWMLAIAFCALGGRTVSAAAYSEFNNPGNFTWNLAPWVPGIPNGVNGAATGISGLVHGGGTLTIDAASTGTTPASLMIGWSGDASLNITGGTLTVGDSNGEGFAIGESGNGVVTQSGSSVVTAAALRFARGSGTGIYNFDGGTLNAGVIVKGGGTSGIFNLNGGTLVPTASNVGWIGTGLTIRVKAGGAKIDTAGFDVTVNSPIVDDGTVSNGGLRKLGSPTVSTGVLRLAAANTYTGDTNIDQGYLVTNVNSALPATTVVRFNNVGNAVSRMDLMSTNQKVAGLVSLAVPTATTDIYSAGNAGSLEVATAVGQTYTFAGNMTGGAMTFKKSGAGTQILSGTNAYTGLTTIAEGTLQIGNNEATTNVGAGAYSVASGAQLIFKRNTAGGAAFSGLLSLSGAGDVVFAGQSTGYFTFRGDYTGTMTQTGKTIVNYAAPIVGTTGWFQNALWLEKSNVMSNATVLDLQAGKVILRAQDVTGITVAGLTGNSGTFITTDNAALVQKFAANVPLGGNYVFNGVIGKDAFAELKDTVSFTKAGLGSQTLTNVNTYTGGTTVSGGTLVLGHATNTLVDTGAVAISGGTLALGANSDTVGAVTMTSGGISSTTGVLTGTSYTVESGTISARLAGNGTLTKNTAGIVTLSGANTYLGATTVNAGRLDLAGSVTSNVTVAPGAGLGGEGSATGSITFIGNTQLSFDPTTPAALMANTVNASAATVTLSLTATAPAAAGIVVLNAPGGITGTAGSGGNFQFTGRGTTYLGAGNTQLLFDYTPANLKWTGTGANPTLWDLNTTVNWVSGANPEKFFTGDSVLFDNTAGNFTVDVLAGGVQPASVTFNHTTPYTLQGGPISGAAALTKNGAGQLTVANNNTFAGGTAIHAGTIQLGNGGTAGSLGAGAILNDGALVTDFGANASTLANDISGSGTLTKNGAGMLIVTGTNSYGGGTTIGTGTVQLGNGGATGSLGGGAVLNNGTLTASYGGNGISVANAIGGTGGFIKEGTGAVTLTGANTFGGGTTINAGTLVVSNGAALSDTGAVNVAAAGASLQLNNSETIGNLTGPGGVNLNGQTLTFGAAGTATYDGVFSGGGQIVKGGAGTQILSAPQTTSLTTVAAGKLQIGTVTSGSLGAGNYAVASGAQLIFARNADDSSFFTQSISGAGDIVFTGQSTGYYTFRGFQYIAASLTYTGKTIVNLSAPVAGTTTWFERALWLEKENVLPDTTVLDLQAGKVILRAQEGLGLTVAGLMGSAGTCITTDQGGIQKVTANVAVGGSYVFGGVIGVDPAFPADLNNNLSFTKTGLGTQVLAGANTYTGLTTVSGGTLLVNGSLSGVSGVGVASGAALGGRGSVGAVTIAGGGTLVPGDNGVGTFSATGLTLGGTSVLDFQLGTPNQPGGTGSDFVAVSGLLTLDGALHITPQAGFGSGNYALFSYGGVLTDSGLQLETAFLDAYPGSTITAGAGTVDLHVVPEPGAAMALLGGLGLLASLRRRARA